MVLLRIKKYYSTSIAWVLLVFVISANSFSQEDGLNFKKISVQDGLSQNWVRCIYNDDEGFMWFGTSGGLNKYDGYEFKHYSLGSVNINAISKKSNHELWVCNDLGLYIYDQKKDSFYLFNKITLQTVLCLLEDSKNKIWIGTNIGLYKYNPANDKLTLYTSISNDKSSLSDNYINKIFEDSEGNIWVGTKKGLNLYLKTKDAFVRFIATGEKGSISGNDVQAIVEDHNKRLWLGTSQDGVHLLTKYDKENFQFRKIIDGYIVNLMVDSHNNLWVARSSNGGLLKVNLNSFSEDQPIKYSHYQNNRLDPRSISDNSIFCIYEDNYQDIWIGTFGSGINYYSPRQKKFYTVEEGISKEPIIKNKLINAFCEDEKYLWIGTEGGLDRYNKITRDTKHFEYISNDKTSLGGNPVYSLFRDSRGNLWVGTWTGGLNLYNYQTESFKRFLPDRQPGSISNGNVFTIFEDSKGYLWIGTIGGGLNRYDYHTGKFKQYLNDPDNPKSLSSNVVNDIKQTKDGKLIISNFNSIEIYDFTTDNFTHFQINDNSISEIDRTFIFSVFVDSENNIWAATNKGLQLFDEKKLFSLKFDINNGLPANSVLAISEDNNGNLWVSTVKGISKFVNGVKLPGTPLFVNFNSLDGLSGNEFKKRAVFKNKEGVIYFGSSNGYTYFDPKEIFLNETKPKVVLEEMKLLKYQADEKNVNKVINNINYIAEIELPYNKSDFIIKYASLNFCNSEENKYKYKLEGYDLDWIDGGNQNFAIYKNLQAGNYTFIVYGSNNDDVWCQIPKKLNIKIRPPWWDTVYFKIGLVALLITLLIAFYKIRFSILKRRNRLLEEKVFERTQELSEINVILEEKQEEIVTQNKELDLHRNNLELLVEQRTAELEIAKVKAEESDRLKTAFLHNISHEIRTPLNAIIGFSNFIKNPELDYEKRLRFADIIVDSGNQLLSIITDIINIATLEAGKEIFIEKGFSVNSLIKTLYSHFAQSAKSKNIGLIYETDINDVDSEIISDETKLAEILSCLIRNAIKFTKEGFVKYGCSIKESVLEFYVEDTGIGILKENQEIIFERFRQIEESTRSEFGGLGLGLSISKLYIELLGGKIWLTSEPDVGTSFYFTIPYKKKSGVLSPEENISVIDKFSDNEKISKTILVAEDEDSNFLLIKELSSNFNVSLIRAFNGIEAIELCKSNPVDIILMDIKMPGMDGMEATKHIRKSFIDIPIIAQTAYTHDSEKEIIMNSGFTDYISKPIMNKEFFRILSKYLKLK